MDMLPDDVLLAIFNSYLDEDLLLILKDRREKAWRLLVHVCRRWRSVVFGSPGHLNLQLVCTDRTPTRDRLDVWPTLPLIVQVGNEPLLSVDNIIAALERRDRVCQIDIHASSSNLEMILVAMQQPFPELTDLRLVQYDRTVAVVPDSFLCGFAPRLQFLGLDRILFPGLQKLPLSTAHLRHLHLFNIHYSEYTSPNAIVTILSALTSLETLTLGFESPRSCPDRATRHPPPKTRSVLPFLSSFMFKGVVEYLEDFVALIDTPRLNETRINVFNDIEFDTPQFIQFISRSPMSRPLEKAHINFWDEAAYVNFLSPKFRHGDLSVEILCSGLDWQVSSVEQVCTSFLTPFFTPEDLYIYERPGAQLEWKGKIENEPWIELLHPFTAVKNLYLCEEVARCITPALQELVEDRITEVLPILENIYLEGFDSLGSVEKGIGRFISAREVAGHPITISSWDGLEKVSRYYDVG